MAEGFGGFDPFTGFGGPYSLHPHLAGSVVQGRTEHFRRGHSGTVGGSVQQHTFGQGLALAGQIGGGLARGFATLATSQAQQAQSRQRAFQGARSLPQATEEPSLGEQLETQSEHSGEPAMPGTPSTLGPISYDINFGQRQKSRAASYLQGMNPTAMAAGGAANPYY